MAAFFTNLHVALVVLGLSAAPLIEAKAAIPIGITVYHMSPLAACLLGTLGMAIAAALLLPILEGLTKWLASLHPAIDRLIERIFSVTRHKHAKSFDRFGALALFIYVALPIPFVGVWSGALLAYLFGIRYRPALLALTLGSAVSSVLVTLATVGVLRLATL